MPHQFKTKIILFRVTEKQHQELKKAADQHDMRLSEYIRWRLKDIRTLKGAEYEFNYTDG